MPSLSFQRRFAPSVKAGAKRQTIRALRKIPIRVGDRLYLFSEQRTTRCERLGVSRCVGADRIFIMREGGGRVLVGLNGECVSDQRAEEIAQSDGFQSLAEMVAWFETVYKRLPFLGQLILWGNLEVPDGA